MHDYFVVGIEIRFFCLLGHFWSCHKSHCSSPITTKGFGGAVSFLFCSAFAKSSLHFRCKEVFDLQKYSTFLNYSIEYFSLKILPCFVIFFHNTLEIQSRIRLTFFQVNIPRANVSNFYFIWKIGT